MGELNEFHLPVGSVLDRVIGQFYCNVFLDFLLYPLQHFLWIRKKHLLENVPPSCRKRVSKRRAQPITTNHLKIMIICWARNGTIHISRTFSHHRSPAGVNITERRHFYNELPKSYLCSSYRRTSMQLRLKHTGKPTRELSLFFLWR